MPSQESEDSDTRYQPDNRANEAEDLGVGASNRAVWITLTIGVGLMLLVLILPYLGSG